jgi:PLD-like domain
VERALAGAVRRGVAVRAIVEPNPSQRSQEALATMARLRRMGVQVKPAGGPYGKTHAKVLLADSRGAWIGSANPVEDWQSTRDFAVVTTEPATLGALAEVFEEDWAGPSLWGRLRPPTGGARRAPDPASRLVVGPENGRAAVTDFLKSATRSLYLEHAVLDDPAIVDLLVQRSRAGVDVQIVLDGDAANERTARLVRQRAPSIRVTLAKSPEVHAKLAIADEERMLVGSHNLTRESLDARREIGIVVDDPLLVGRALDAVRRDLGGQGASPAARGQRPRVIESVLRLVRAAGPDGAGRPGWLEALFRLAAAVALAAGIAYRPWRRFGLGLSWPAPREAVTQVLLAVAGAIVGLHAAGGPDRAVGLLALAGGLALALHLAGVLRFEAGVRDGRGAARLLVPAGLGLACGLGLLGPALLGAALGLAALALLDRGERAGGGHSSA